MNKEKSKWIALVDHDNLAKRVLRVGLLLLLVCSIAIFFVARRIRANAGNALVQFGKPLMHLPQGARGEQLELTINGYRFAYASGLSSKSPSALAEDLEKGCAKYSLGISSSAQLKQRKIQPSLIRTHENQGTVACFGKIRGIDTIGDWIKHIGDFSHTGDLSTFGTLQFAYVEKARKGTRYVALSSMGSLNFKSMFPLKGDASGADIKGLPRPPKARRILSTLVGGRDEHITLYESTVSEIEKLSEMYTPILKKDGWLVTALSTKACKAKQPCIVSHTIQKGTRAFLMGIGRGENNTSIVSFVNMVANVSANTNNLALK